MEDQANLSQIFKAQLTDEEFNKLSSFIFNNYGIKMPPVKKVMLQSRLQKRLRALNLVNFGEYCNYVFSDKGQETEVIHMIDVVSTNKTDFFREPIHFEFMQMSVLPAFVEKHQQGKEIKIWSAGCSSGEEPYTIGITMEDFLSNYPRFHYSILATDISSRILKSAVDGIYKEEKVDGIPLEIKKKYFLRSKDKTKNLVRIIPQIRKNIIFKRLNFMDEKYDVDHVFDMIFCRNVLIYFDRGTQENVINKLCTHLKPGGYLFLGHSESITNIKVPLQQIRPTIFIRL
ncbi:MAG: CheR family methyltransferase [Bacteroidota bacterium]